MKLLSDLFGNPQVNLHNLGRSNIRYPDKLRTSTRKYKFIDLFCGAGAFHLALKEHECVLACDIMNHVKIMYEYNYPGTPFAFDVYKLNANNLPYHDIICGGFPCQAFSTAGIQRGFDDERGVLFFEIVRLAKIYGTKALLLENVPGLVNHDKNRTYQVILKTLWDAGYVVYHKILGAHTHGNIPQTRRRLFIVAFHKEKVKNHSQFRFPSPIKLTKKVNDYLLPDEMIEEKYWVKEGTDLWHDIENANFIPGKLYRRMYGIWTTSKGDLCRTLCAKDGQGRLRHKGTHIIMKTKNGRYRAITPREVFNLMGFPPDFKIVPGIKDYVPYQMAGNSIVVSVIRRLANNILHVLDNCKDAVTVTPTHSLFAIN